MAAGSSHHPSLGNKIENLTGDRVRKVAYKVLSKYGYQTVRQIVELAHLNHVKIAFLYLPEYAYAANPQSEGISFYADLGPVLISLQNVVANRLNWWDFAHLNRVGSRKLVAPVSAAMVEYLTGEATTGRNASEAARANQ